MRYRLIPALALLFLASCATLQEELPASAAPEVDVVPVVQAPAPTITETRAPDTSPPEPASPSYDSVWERLIARFSLPSCENQPAALRWADWYAAEPEYMARIFKRAEPWIYDIAEQLEQRGMPGELALLPIVESAYDPFAYSHGQAVGTWQFIAATGRRYGLHQDWWYDGRRDVYAATRAALDYLQYLNDYFEGDWLLALAAYNAGENRVRRTRNKQLKRGKPADYWNLPLPRETRGYVPKLLGLQCVFAIPERYGFTIPKVDNQPKIRPVDTRRQIDLVVAAQLAGIGVADLFALNAGYNRWATAPAGPHRIILPLAAAQRFEAVRKNNPTAALMRWDQLTVANGDTLGGLAAKHSVPLEVIMTSNGLSNDRIHSGQQLRLPRDGGHQLDPLYASAANELQQLQAKLVAPDRINHRIRNGESLSTIAKRYRVRVSDLQRWNNIRDPHRIRAGQKLVIFHSPVARPGRSNSGQSDQYVVRNGDSLWVIARRHKVTIDDLKRWNNLSGSSILRPGQQLKLAP